MAGGNAGVQTLSVAAARVSTHPRPDARGNPRAPLASAPHCGLNPPPARWPGGDIVRHAAASATRLVSTHLRVNAGGNILFIRPPHSELLPHQPFGEA